MLVGEAILLFLLFLLEGTSSCLINYYFLNSSSLIIRSANGDIGPLGETALATV